MIVNFSTIAFFVFNNIVHQGSHHKSEMHKEIERIVDSGTTYAELLQHGLMQFIGLEMFLLLINLLQQSISLRCSAEFM